MSRDIAPFGLRMQPELKKQVEKAARASGRSLNAEICHRLAQSFGEQASLDQTSEQTDTDLAGRVAELERRVAELEHRRR